MRRLAAGERLIAAGEPNAAVYLVHEGRLREQPAAPGSDPIAVYGPGEIAGVVSALAGLPAAASLVAEAETRVQVIEAPRVWSLAELSPAAARKLLASLVDFLRRTETHATGCHEGLRRAYERHRLVDELTGLRNRRGFENALARLAARCAMNRDRLSVILFRIEAFPDYCHRFGDAGAEAALYTVARVLEDSLRPTDLLARYGEQAFAAALPYTDRTRAVIVAERLREAVAEAVVVMDDDSLLPSVSVTFGVAEKADHEGIEDLIRRAYRDLATRVREGSSGARAGTDPATG